MWSVDVPSRDGNPGVWEVASVGVDIQRHQLPALLVPLVALVTALEAHEVGLVGEAGLEVAQVESVAVGGSAGVVGLMEVEGDLIARGGREEVSGIRVGVGPETVGVGIRMGRDTMERHHQMPLRDQVGGDLVVVEVGMRMAEGDSAIGADLETEVEEVGLVAVIVDSAVIGTVGGEMVGMAGGMEVIGMALVEGLVTVIGVGEMVGMVEVGMVVVALEMIMAGRGSMRGMDIVVAEATLGGEGIRPPLPPQKTPRCAFG